MKGCSNKGKNPQCIYNHATHQDHRFRNDIWKTALMETVSFIMPFRDVHLTVLGPIGAEVAWHVVMRSLPCNMGSSYLADWLLNPGPLKDP